jgi:ATP-dependent DNA helicase RecG
MPTTRLKIFISSVQKEFQQIRKDLKSFLLGDAVLRRFISDVFLFEDLPASDRRADEVYLDEVSRCNLYLGIFGNDYGSEDEQGLSPTEREFLYATQHHKTRLIYVWGMDDKNRSPKMVRLIRRAGSELIRRRVADVNALTSEVYASLVEHLDRLGALRVPPFDTTVCHGASLEDLSRQRIEWFLETARRERGFPLKPNTTTRAFLGHLNLLDGPKPTNAAILLFGSVPHKFHRTAETKCVRCHGTKYLRPFASQQIYSGDLFDQVDQARDFVLGKIDRAVGTRETGSTAPATYELPPDAITEAIVNAVAHRDYNSHASVEVRLFADRLEVWNPGTLPGTLSLESLHTDHPSVPFNPLIAESLYLARYVEKAGSGTQRMIELCKDAGLPEPDFELRQGSFVITLWKNWLTLETIEDLKLNERQKKAVQSIKSDLRLTNSGYQDQFGVSKPTASRDLDDLVSKGVLERSGTTGKGTYYELNRKGLTKGSKGSRRQEKNGS